MNEALHPSSDLFDLLKPTEDKRLVGYLDRPGGVPTVGIGHTGPEVYVGMVITEEQCSQYLAEDVFTAREAVRTLVRVALTQSMFDALISFVFNVGRAQFQESTLLRQLNASAYQGAADQFPRWVYDDGKVEGGLVTRRAKERALFLKDGIPT